MESTTEDFFLNSTGFSIQEVAPAHGLKWEIKVFMFLGALGVLDNGFTLVVILSSKKMTHKVNNKLIINQSAIDWLASVLLFVDAPTYPNPRSPPGVAGELYCRLWVSNYFLWSAITSSSLNLMAIAIERYIEIVTPLSYKHIFTPLKARLTMLGVWIAGWLAMTVPCIAGSGIIDTVCLRYTVWPSDIGNILSGVHTFLVMYLIPLIGMIYCYTRILMVFRAKSKVKPRDMHKTIAERRRDEKMLRIERNIMKTLILVTVAFIACWSCNLWAFFFLTLGVSVDLNSSYYQVFIFLTYTNCWINPFIYTFQYQEFQEAMKQLFCTKPVKDDDDSIETERTPSNAIAQSNIIAL